MKSLVISLLGLCLIASATARGNNAELEKRFAAEMRQFQQIYPALVDYEKTNKSLPSSLLSLVTENLLKPEDIQIKLADDSLHIPTYIPGQSIGAEPESILLSYDLPETDQRLVLKSNGTVAIEEKPLFIDPKIKATPAEELAVKVAEMRKEFAELSQKYREKHPKMIIARAELENAEQRLAAALIAEGN